MHRILHDAGPLVVCLTLVPSVALADDPPVGTIRVASIAAIRVDTTTTAMQIDGELTEAVWSKTPVVSGFMQRVPHEGAPATHPTEVRVAYDTTALYVAVTAFDPEPDRIAGILTRRDEQWWIPSMTVGRPTNSA